MSGDLSRKAAFGALAAITLLGASLRLAVALFDRPLIPDEFFQYLEPAWCHLSGAGIETWEWDEGLRSWVLPFFNGAWMALWRALGVRGGAQLGTLVKVHWALINTGLVLVAWRGGSALARRLARADGAPELPGAGAQGGLLAAGLCAAFAPLVIYGGHVLSELPSMLCLLAGLVLTAELTEQPAAPPSPALLRKAAWSGALLSLGACLRIANGPLTLIAPAWLLCTGRRRLLLALLGAALLPALLFGLVDLFSWGTFAGSFVRYVEFNLVEGGAARYGTSGPAWYLQRLWQTAPFGLPLLVAAALHGLRASWPYLLSAALMVAYLSIEPHKELRFVLAFWPLLSIAAAGALGAWIARAGAPAAGRWPRRPSTSAARWGVALALVLLVLVESARDTHADHFLDVDRFRAHAWLGRRTDVSGALIDAPLYTGGGLWFDSRAPQIRFKTALLANPLISHVIVRRGSSQEQASRARGFAEIHHQGAFVVLARR